MFSAAYNYVTGNHNFPFDKQTENDLRYFREELRSNIQEQEVHRAPRGRSSGGDINLTCIPISIGNSRPASHPSRRDRDNDEGMRVLVGVAAAAIAFVFAFVVGDSIKQYEKASEDLKRAENFKNRVSAFQGNQEVKDLLDDVADKTIKLYKKQQRSVYVATALKVMVFAGAIIALVGAIAAPPVVMAIGAAIAGAGALGLLVKLGYEWDDRNTRTLSQQITEEANTLLNTDWPEQAPEGYLSKRALRESYMTPPVQQEQHPAASAPPLPANAY